MKIETVSGVKFNTFTPDPNDVRLDDIAWATSRMPRFAGHTIPMLPYSVAQHAVAVSNELLRMFDSGAYDQYGEEMSSLIYDYLDMYNFDAKLKFKMAMHGLMHDAAEAYIGDIPSPVKHLPGLCDAIKSIEDGILKAIYTSFKIEYPTEEEWVFIHHADMVQRTIEAYNFMHSRGKDWGDLPDVSLRRLQAFNPPMPSIQAYDEFLEKFRYLRGKI
jgi:hypothetical protein